MSKLSEAISEMRNMRESYDQLVEQNAQLAANVQSIKDAHILGFNYDGIVFAEGFGPQSAFGIIANKSKILEIHDNKDRLIPSFSASDFPELEEFEMSEATGYQGTERPPVLMDNSTSIKKVKIPNISGVFLLGYGGTMLGFSMRYCVNLIEVDIKNTGAVNSYTLNDCPFRGCDTLIDIIYGAAISSSTNLLDGWSPTVALLSNDSSLLTPADISNGFTSNREKLLHNIREHIAANLNPNIQKTFKFSVEVYAAIVADQDTADAFPASWTIASV